MEGKKKLYEGVDWPGRCDEANGQPCPPVLDRDIIVGYYPMLAMRVGFLMTRMFCDALGVHFR